jgi:hypothetical protein
VISQRFAGAEARTRDVATDYVDVGGGAGAVVRRVVAMARNGLLIGLTQAFLPDYSHLILLLCGDAKRDEDLMHMLVSACSRLAHRPVVVGLGSLDCDHLGLRKIARAASLVYLDCDLSGADDPQAMWAAAEPALDFSLAANSSWPPDAADQMAAA